MSDRRDDDPLAGLGEDPRRDAAEAAAWDPALSEPVRKGGFPRWVWIGCGCGCAVMILAALALAIGSWMMFKDAADPEAQWPKLRAVLPYDERPADLELLTGVDFFGMYAEFRLRDREDGYYVIVRKVGDASQLDVLMDPEARVPGATVVGGEQVELTLQGRTVDAMRFQSVDEEVPFALGEAAEQAQALGEGLRVELPRSGTSVVVELRAESDAGPVTDQQVEDFFGHFDLWR